MILLIRPALGGYKIKNKEGTALASIRQQKLLQKTLEWQLRLPLI